MCQEDPRVVTLKINTGGGDLRNFGGIDAVRFRLLCLMLLDGSGVHRFGSSLSEVTFPILYCLSAPSVNYFE